MHESMEHLRSSKNGRLCGAMFLLTLLFLNGSCAKSGVRHTEWWKSESGYQILSEAQAHELFGKLRSQDKDIEAIQQFFGSKSFSFERVEALREGSRLACIAFYTAKNDSEHLGILAIKVRGDAVVETTAGILWLTGGGTSFANEIGGPKVASSSAISLCGWWSCLFPLDRRGVCPGYDPSNPSPRRRVTCLEANSGFPLVYYWLRHCY
jgi:hypothetical protein